MQLQSTFGGVADVADRRRQIYDTKFREKFEAQHPGMFVAIDVTNGEAHTGGWSEEALMRGRQSCPYGVLQLIRVGHHGAFRFRSPGISRNHSRQSSNQRTEEVARRFAESKSWQATAERRITEFGEALRELIPQHRP